MATLFLELTRSPEAQDEKNYMAKESLLAAHTIIDQQELAELTIKITDVSLFQPLQLSSFAFAQNAKVVFDVAIADIPRVHTACVLSGLQVFSERTNGTDRRVITATKPQQQQQQLQQFMTQRPLQKINDINDTMIIDEDALLQEEGDWAPDTKTATKVKSSDDCGGRQLCDNCTCGRGGAKGAENQNVAPTNNVTSNCGKCGMGDAFRCASCPFLGKPAFKPGQEHLVLDLQDDL